MRPFEDIVADLPRGLRALIMTVWRTGANMGRHAGPQRATALAFYGFLSLFPLTVFAVSIASLWFPSAEVLQWFGVQLERFLLPDAAAIVEEAVGTALRTRGAVTVVAVIGLLYSGSGFVAGLAGTLDAVWQEPSRRFFLVNRVVAAGFTLLGGIALAVSAGLTTLALEFWPQLMIWLGVGLSQAVRTVGAVLVGLLTLGLDVVLGTLIYRFLPSQRAPWRAAWIAGAVNGVGWNLLKIGFSYYLTRFSRYGLVYGTLSSVIGVLIWAQLAATVFVFAGELSAVLAPRGKGEVQA